eukprot:scaffold47757_cov66-Cyclotella_meneghiniana.AAC.1
MAYEKAFWMEMHLVIDLLEHYLALSSLAPHLGRNGLTKSDKTSIVGESLPGISDGACVGSLIGVTTGEVVARAVATSALEIYSHTHNGGMCSWALSGMCSWALSGMCSWALGGTCILTGEVDGRAEGLTVGDTLGDVEVGAEDGSAVGLFVDGDWVDTGCFVTGCTDGFGLAKKFI